jgi:hypothetical protein
VLSCFLAVDVTPAFLDVCLFAKDFAIRSLLSFGEPKQSPSHGRVRLCYVAAPWHPGTLAP